MYRYKPTVNFQRFDNRYFSGADVSVYFGSKSNEVDEVTYLDFVLIERVEPIYGYNSMRPDALVAGNRMVRGNFSINFVSPGYLFSKIPYTDRDAKKAYASPVIVTEPGKIVYGITKEEFALYEEAYAAAFWGDNRRTDPNSRPYFTRSSDGFTITIKYGEDTAAYNKRPPELVGTKHIVGVKLMSVQQVVDTSGRPIAESYSFIAKDLI